MNFNATSAAKTLVFEIRNEQGEITISSNLTAGPIIVKIFDGDGFTAYTTAGTAKVLDDSTNNALIQGPGRFEITKPENIPLSFFPGMDTSVKLISGFV